MFINIVVEGRRAVTQIKTTNKTMSERNLNKQKGKRTDIKFDLIVYTIGSIIKVPESERFIPLSHIQPT